MPVMIPDMMRSMRGCQAEFASDEEAAFAHPVLLLEEGYILLAIRDLVLLQPDIEHQLADEAVDAGLVGGVAADVDPILDLEQDIEHPLAVRIVEVLAHDEHVEHVGPGALHDHIVRLDVFWIIRADDLFQRLQALGVVGMQIMGFVRFDIIPALVGHNDRRLSQQLFPVRVRQDGRPLALYRARLLVGEVATIMDKPRIIRREVLPGPVQGRQFTVMRILRADVVAGIVSHKAYILFSFFTDMYRQIRIV